MNHLQLIPDNLSPRQARNLWDFLERLSGELWKKYEKVLLEQQPQKAQNLSTFNDWPF